MIFFFISSSLSITTLSSCHTLNPLFSSHSLSSSPFDPTRLPPRSSSSLFALSILRIISLSFPSSKSFLPFLLFFILHFLLGPSSSSTSRTPSFCCCCCCCCCSEEDVRLVHGHHSSRGGRVSGPRRQSGRGTRRKNAPHQFHQEIQQSGLLQPPPTRS